MLNDEVSGGGTWLDASLVPVADYAQADAVSIFPPECLAELDAVATFTLTAATGSELAATFDLSSATDIAKIRAVRLRATATAPYYRAQVVRIEQLWDNEAPGSGHEAEETKPICAIHGQKGYAFPGPMAGANSAQVFYTKAPTRITATSAFFEINEIYQRLLYWPAAAMALMKIGADNRASLAEQTWLAEVKALWDRHGDGTARMPADVARRLYGGAVTK